MLQGGDIQNGNGTGGDSIYGGNFEDEPFLAAHAARGYLSMANAGPNTNSSQFFVTFKETAWLDGKHVVFGKVSKNIELLDKIENLETGEQDKPKQDVTIVECGAV